MFLLYNFLLTILAPFWVPWMVARSRRRKEGVNWSERQGNYKIPPRGDRRRVWFHAVSVGEVMASLPILRELRAELPDHEIVLTVTTSSGHQTAREQATGLFDHLVYFPIDIARFQLAAVQRVRPDAVAIMETELWMNFLWAAKTFDAQTLLINGRISDRSFPRSQKLKFFYRPLLRDVDRCLMQSEIDADRIRALGAKNAEVLGNSKFDQALEGLDASRDLWQGELGLDPTRPVVVVGSLRAEEFAFFAEAMDASTTATNAQWIIAPRHLERIPELVQALCDRPIAYRSKGEKLGESNVMILDTYGELGSVYSVADVVVVGGGFANLGGQNMIQPLAHGKPVIVGKYTQNFRDIASMAAHVDASMVAETAVDLSKALDDLLANPALRSQMGAAAAELVQSNTGASRRYAQAIAQAARQGEADDRSRRK